MKLVTGTRCRGVPKTGIRHFEELSENPGFISSSVIIAGVRRPERISDSMREAHSRAVALRVKVEERTGGAPLRRTSAR